MADQHILTPSHADALVRYVKFLRTKRDQCVAEVAAEFKELRELRLFEEKSYATDEVEAMLDGLLATVRLRIKTDLQQSMHSTVLLMKQLVEQAEKSGLSLQADLSAIEDRKLLEAVAAWENSLSGGGAVPQLKAKAMSSSRPAAALPVIGQVQDPKLLEQLESQKEDNHSLNDKFQKLQIQCTGILKEKTQLKAQLDALAAENKSLSSASSTSGDSAKALQGQVARLEAELAALRAAPPEPVVVTDHASVDSLKAELQSAQERAADLSGRLEEAQQEIQARVEKSKQFANMRQMLAKKNAVLKGLREQLVANGIAVAGDVSAYD